MQINVFNSYKVGFLFLALLIIYTSCKPKHPPVSFYYWKQEFTLSKRQSNLLKDTKTNKIYLKFFDIVIDEEINEVRPNAIISFETKPNLEIIPCVFVQNKVFESNSLPREIAFNSNRLIKQIIRKNKLIINEIQIDCDWTQSTKSNYFLYLKELTRLNPKIQFTSTLRLHQLKDYKNTGIPPVKKVLLMCYNVGDIENFSSENSILSPRILNDYISKDMKYPLKLDLALPIYQWALVFRLGKLNLIINDLEKKKLNNKNFKPISKNYYQVTKNHYINNNFLNKGDLIRFECSQKTDLKKCVQLFQESNLNFNQVIFYHISQNNIQQYHADFFNQINTNTP